MRGGAVLRVMVVLMCAGCADSLDLDHPSSDDALVSGSSDGSTRAPDAAPRRDGEPPDQALTDARPPNDAAVALGDTAPLPRDAVAPPVDVAAPPPPPDASPPPPVPARDCVYDSRSFGQPPVELDVGPNSADQLTFLVPGLPDPALVEAATLIFESYDADHPGQEGIIEVNGAGPFDLPAMATWDNQAGTGVVDITGATVAGDNRVAFGPGPLDRSFFGIANVRVTARARVDACVAPPPPPSPEARVREIRYPQAHYSNRPTWVVGCENNPARAYAYTASGEEHVGTDCEGLYRAGGNRRGDALFAFDDVADATYDVVIGSRHTGNRSVAGALFLVNGDPQRVSQRSERGVTEDTWGRRRLSGRVEVIMRSEGDSDSVILVRLVPAGG